ATTKRAQWTTGPHRVDQPATNAIVLTIDRSLEAVSALDHVVVSAAAAASFDSVSKRLAVHQRGPSGCFEPRAADFFARRGVFADGVLPTARARCGPARASGRSAPT